MAMGVNRVPVSHEPCVPNSCCNTLNRGGVTCLAALQGRTSLGGGKAKFGTLGETHPLFP